MAARRCGSTRCRSRARLLGRDRRRIRTIAAGKRLTGGGSRASKPRRGRGLNAARMSRGVGQTRVSLQTPPEFADIAVGIHAQEIPLANRLRTVAVHDLERV